MQKGKEKAGSWMISYEKIRERNIGRERKVLKEKKGWIDEKKEN